MSLALVLFALGGGIFRYLTASPRLVVAQDRPIAIATAFVPATSPFSASLLTSPETLRAFTQSDNPASQPVNQIGRNEQQATSENQQLKQSLLAQTGLDYDRDLLPWLGNEVTFALTEADVDFDASNGAQPGYLLAAAIAPQKSQEARAFLQRLWQQRSLSGKGPASERVNGVRVLYRDDLEAVTAASALVGDRFVLLANDDRVLRRSLRVAQSATNLAQNRTYRETVAQLPEQRVGLAYWQDDTQPYPTRSHTAMSIELAPGGLLAKLQHPGIENRDNVASSVAMDEPTAAMAFLPAESAWAINGTNLAQRLPSLGALGISQKELPQFLAWGESQKDLSIWNWAAEDYALGRVGEEWVLAVRRDEAGLMRLDAAAREEGFSVVPVALDADSTSEMREAIAWTRFKAKPSYRASNSRIETEVLGLHIAQGNYEIFASSLGVIEQAIAASGGALLGSAQFAPAVTVLPNPNGGYLYWNKATITSRLKRQQPLLQKAAIATEPLLTYVRSLTAAQTSDGEFMNAFVQMSR